jgi:hypothetical protein
MPRTSDWFLDCVFYIYNSELAANENDERVGGSGFLVAKRRPDNPSAFQIFGVTAAHVISGAKTPFLRFNKRFENEIQVLEVSKSKWKQHFGGDDISVARLEISPHVYRTLCIETERFVTDDVLTEKDIGIGDNVFMVGRFVHHSGGVAQNIPSVRFGNIAMMNRQRIRRDDGALQETSWSNVAQCQGTAVRPFLFISMSLKNTSE